MEDILNRGGGRLCLQLAWATEDERLDMQRSVSVAVDGRQRTLKPGETLVLNPGQGVCLPPTLYHRFWAENALVMGWEISMVNDDKRDNRFLEDSGRFPMIQEDEPKNGYCAVNTALKRDRRCRIHHPLYRRVFLFHFV